ncbi:MAG: HupE/UreJ family protein [Pirellulaceae bacterium]
MTAGPSTLGGEGGRRPDEGGPARAKPPTEVSENRNPHHQPSPGAAPRPLLVSEEVTTWRTESTTRYLLILALAIILGMVTSTRLFGHEIRPALLEINERQPGFFDVTWKVPALGDRVLGLAPVFPEVMQPVGPPSHHLSPGALVQYFSFKTDGQPITGETIFMEGLSALQIDVLIRINLANGDHHAIILRPKTPSYVIPERASKSAVAWSYMKMGVIHIFEGIDHLLFVLALVIIVPNMWTLLKTITAFTLAHSVTLALATLGFVHVPSGPTEAVIALSIVFLAVEIVRSRRGEFSLTAKYPWIVAMIFGLVHGLGFAGALSEVGLPQHEIPLALLMFNVGVELGQIAFVLVIVTILGVFRFACKKLPSLAPVSRWQLVPYIIGIVAAFWTIERTIGFMGLA